MKTLCLILFLCLATFTVSAQIINQKAENKIIELRKAGVDTILNYAPYCPGSIRLVDNAKCIPYDIAYVFWIRKGITYGQRFDECYNYKPVTGKNTAIMAFIKTRLATMQKEDIMPVAYQEKHFLHTETITVSIDHTCHTYFCFYTGVHKTIKDLDNFRIETPFVNDTHNSKIKYPNINYAYNQRTYLNQLKTLVEKQATVLEQAKIK